MNLPHCPHCPLPLLSLSYLLLQYKMAESSLLSRTLWLSVWDWDRFGRNQFLGEVRVALKEFDLSTHIEKWYPLKDKVGDGRGWKDSTSHTRRACVPLPLSN